jgi:hypothetical protein
MRDVHPTNLFTRLIVAAALLSGAACHDGTSAPPPPLVSFDAPHALTKIEPVAAVFDQPILKSFDAAMSYFEGYFRSGVAFSLRAAPARSALSFGVTRNLAAVAQAATANIPADVKGKTFVYDTNTGTYEIEPAVTGAPSNGVRFLLYLWDGSLGRPATPLTRIGAVDIEQVSQDGASSQVVDLVVSRQAPFLVAGDFEVTHRVNNGTNVFSIEGSATDGFSVDIVQLDGTESGADGHHHLVFNTTLSSSPPAVSAVEQLVSDQATASQSGRLDLQYEGHTFTDQSVTQGVELTFDGRLYAKILFPTPPQTDARYVRADGTPLPTQEIVDLQALLNRTVATQFFWISLAWP